MQSRIPNCPLLFPAPANGCSFLAIQFMYIADPSMLALGQSLSCRSVHASFLSLVSPATFGLGDAFRRHKGCRAQVLLAVTQRHAHNCAFLLLALLAHAHSCNQVGPWQAPVRMLVFHRLQLSRFVSFFREQNQSGRWPSAFQ